MLVVAADGSALLLNPWLSLLLLDFRGDRDSISACSFSTDNNLLLTAGFTHDIGSLFGSGVRVTERLVSSHLRVRFESALCLLDILVQLLFALAQLVHL